MWYISSGLSPSTRSTGTGIVLSTCTATVTSPTLLDRVRQFANNTAFTVGVHVACRSLGPQNRPVIWDAGCRIEYTIGLDAVHRIEGDPALGLALQQDELRSYSTARWATSPTQLVVPTPHYTP